MSEEYIKLKLYSKFDKMATSKGDENLSTKSISFSSLRFAKIRKQKVRQNVGDNFLKFFYFSCRFTIAISRKLYSKFDKMATSKGDENLSTKSNESETEDNLDALDVSFNRATVLYLTT